MPSLAILLKNEFFSNDVLFFSFTEFWEIKAFFGNFTENRIFAK
jgi:hypothetical protein